MEFTCLKMDTKKFTAFMKKAVAKVEVREDLEAFIWVIDEAKERGIIEFDVWRSLNNLATARIA